jgi:hypothetical protein
VFMAAAAARGERKEGAAEEGKNLILQLIKRDFFAALLERLFSSFTGWLRYSAESVSTQEMTERIPLAPFCAALILELQVIAGVEG